MHEHATRKTTTAPATRSPAARAAVPDGLSAAGNRALGDALSARPVQRDLADYLPDAPSLPDIGSLLPSLPQLPGVNLNIDTDAGTASGGIDFHNGTTANANYGSAGLDASGTFGNASVKAHADALNDWNVQGRTTTRGGTQIDGGISDSTGDINGRLGILGSGGDAASLAGGYGSGGLGGAATYAGQYGNVDLGY